MSGFTCDSPQISASPHQLDLAPYASEPYNAQWNAPGLLCDKHALRSSRILGVMEVDEPWLGLRLPLNYQVDMAASQRRFRNLPFGGRAKRDSRDACSTKGIRAESPPTFI